MSMLKGSASEGERLIDALPYIDTISPEETKMVTKLISEEMGKSDRHPSDYLKEMANEGAPTFGGSPLLQQEYQRVKDKQSMPPLDTHRYTVSAPPLEQQNELDAWKKAADNACAQLEHQHLRILNLELCLKYGPELWRMANAQTNKLAEDFSEEVEKVKESITEINKHRKLSQTEIGAKLQKVESEWAQLIIKNFQISQACCQKRSLLHSKDNPSPL